MESVLLPSHESADIRVGSPAVNAEVATPVAVAPIIRVRGVVRDFGAVRAVDGVDLDVSGGELFGLIGHNGAGKSTLFRMMLGLLAPSRGEIRIDACPSTSRGFRAVRRRIGFLPENVVLYDNLSALETLQFFARLKGVDPSGCAALLARVGLAGTGRRRVREFSKGMRQRLGFAQALLGRPRLLFLDEPTSGLDPEAIRHFYATLRALRAEGVTVVLSSHILAEIQDRVDRLAIMARGRVQAIGSVRALRERVDLPVRFEVRVSAADLASVREALGHLPALSVATNDDHVAVECRPDAKLAVIAALARLGDRILDLSVREPSLEDVFFGISE